MATLASSVGGAFGRYAAMETIQATVEYLKTHETERTQREYIRAKRDVLVTVLNTERDCLLAYFEHRFAERRSALEEFYRLLHTAVESGDTKQLQASLAGILGIIQDNPLDDLVEFREKWSNPEFTIEL